MSSFVTLPSNQNNNTTGGGEGYAASSDDSGTVHQQPPTCWCHECGMSMTLLPSSSPTPPTFAPSVTATSLRRWSPPSPPPPHSNSLTFSLSDSDSDSDIPDLDLLVDSLDDPRRRRRIPAQVYLCRLIHHLTVGDDHPLSFPIPVRGPSPAPKSSIDALPIVQISPSTLMLASSLIPTSTTLIASSPGSPSITLAPSAVSTSPMMTPSPSSITVGPACLSSSGVSLMMMMRMTVVGPWPSRMHFNI